MPTGWFIVQPPASGTLRAPLKKTTPSLGGQQLTDGSIAPIALDKVAVSLAGQHPMHGPMAIALKKLTFSLLGEEKTFGGLSIELGKVSTFFDQDLFSGTMFSQLKPIALLAASADTPQGEIATRTGVISAALGGFQEYTGVLGARLREAAAIIAGAHSQDGVLSAAAKEATTAATGETSAPKLISSTHVAGDTATMPAHQTGDTILIFVSRTGSATPALQSGWTNILNGNRAVGTGNWSARVAYKVAASSAETVGTWSTTEQMIILVYRNVSAIGAATSGAGTTNTTVTYPAATLLGTNGKSTVLRMARGGGASSLTSDLLTNAPISGYTIRAGNDFILAMDASLVGTNPVAQNQVTNNNWWWAVTIELRSN